MVQINNRIVLWSFLPCVILFSVFFAMSYFSPLSAGAEQAASEGQPQDPDDIPIEIQSRNILRFGVHVSGMGTLDPHFAAGSQDRAFADMVFNGLLRYQPGNAPRIEPDLAESIPDFKMIGGQQIWTLKLRKGVMFHAGPKTKAYELTADDVVFSINKSANEATCAYAGEYAGIKVEKLDTYTVRFVLDKPISPTLFLPKLTNYAGGFIVSKRAIEAMGYDAYQLHPVGTGPFVFKKYSCCEQLFLKAHEQYFRGRPHLDGVTFYFIPDIETRESLLKSGRLDVIAGSGVKGWIKKMETVNGLTIDTHGVGEVITIYLNTSMKPLDDIRVRRAIAYALDREAFLNTSSKRLVGGVYSPVPDPFLPGSIKKEEIKRLNLEYATNLQKARALMLEAGYPDGFAMDVVVSEKRIYQTCYDVLASQLDRIGIKCRINLGSHSRMHKLIRQEPKPIVIYVAWRPNADAFLSRFFHSDSIVVNGKRPDTNFSHYRKIDRLIEDARLEISPEKQINLWAQAQIRILNDVAALPIMFLKQCFARRVGVHYGHPLISTMSLYPQFTEKTRIDVQE